MKPVPVQKRRTAALAAISAIVAALLAVNVAILLHPEQLRRRLTAYTKRFVRGEVRLEGVRFGLTGRGSVARAVLRPGPGADVSDTNELRIEGLTLENAPLELLRGRYVVEEIRIDRMEARIDDPIGFLDTFRRLIEIDPHADAPPAPVTIGRLAIRLERTEIPLGPTGTGTVLAFERVKLVPEASGRRFWRLSATYEAGPFEECAVGGRIDMLDASLALDVRASNVDVRGRSLAGLPRGVREAIARLGPSGPFDVALSATVPWQRLGETRVAGEIDCYALSLTPRGFPRPFTNIAGRVRFAGERVEIPELRGLYGTSALRVHGAIPDLAALCAASFGEPGEAEPPRGDTPSAGPGLDLVLTAARFELDALRELPLPPPFGAAVAALALGGHGDLRLAIATPWNRGLEEARLRGALVGRGEARAGPLRGIAGELAFEGDRLSRAAEGTIRIARAEIGGIPLRAAVARASLDESGIAFERGEGRLAGEGLFRASGRAAFDPGGSAAIFRADVTAQGVDAAPLASAAFGEPLSFRGRAAGTLSYDRGALRAELELEGVEPCRIPTVAPICAALGHADGPDLPALRYERGRCEVALDPARSGRFVLDLRGPGPRALLARGAFEAGGGALAATAEAVGDDGRLASFALSGALARPEVRAAVETPEPPTGTAR